MLTERTPLAIPRPSPAALVEIERTPEVKVRPSPAVVLAKATSFALIVIPSPCPTFNTSPLFVKPAPKLL